MFGEEVVKTFSSKAFEALSTVVPTGRSKIALQDNQHLLVFCVMLIMFTYTLFLCLYLCNADPNWSISDFNKSNKHEGLLTSKVLALVELLLEYRYGVGDMLVKHVYDVLFWFFP